MLIRQPKSTKKIIIISVLFGLLIALIVTSLQAFYQHSQRQKHYDLLLKELGHYLDTYLIELKATTDTIQPLTVSRCDDIASELASSSAHDANIRAFLLVKDDVAYCSSASGSISLPMKKIAPDIDTHKMMDIDILENTPLQPEKPAIAVWFSNPLLDGRGVFTTLNVNLKPYIIYTTRQREVTGMALVVHDKAFYSFSNSIMTHDQLPKNQIGVSSVLGYPIALHIYGNLWSFEDVMIAMVPGLFIGIICAFTCAYILISKRGSDREILTGIKRNQFFNCLAAGGQRLNAGNIRC